MGAQQGDVKEPFLFVNGIHQHFVEGLVCIRPFSSSLNLNTFTITLYLFFLLLVLNLFLKI